MWFCCFSQRAIHGVNSPCSHRSVIRWGEHIRCQCVLFVSSRSGIVFNLIAGAITDHSQSAKDIDPYFKSPLYVEDPGHRKSVFLLPNGLSKSGERAHDKLNFRRGWDSNSQPLDRQSSVLPLSYHRFVCVFFHVEYITGLHDAFVCLLSCWVHYLTLTIPLSVSSILSSTLFDSYDAFVWVSYRVE